MSQPYDLQLTATAEATFVRLHQEAQACIEAGDESNSKVILFRMVEEIITKIIPHEPFSAARALSGKLSNFFRVKKGRIRVCYVASSKHRRIVILYISETPRKEGDVKDPYSVLTRMVVSGKFDDLIAELGIRSPVRRSFRQQRFIKTRVV